MGVSKVTRMRKRRAASADLAYVNDFEKGYSRRRCGRGFLYLGTRGKTLRSERIKKRIQSLAIPPAWEDVWICPTTNGHIQARGTDDEGRTQYIYHDDWVAISARTKFDRMHLLAELLPRIRRRVRRDLSGDGMEKSRIAAAIVRLIDRGRIRVGNARSAEDRNARGATTLAAEHVEVEDFAVSLDFPGKGGQRRKVLFNDRKVAEVIRDCEEIDGQFLFTYEGLDGDHHPMSSSDVNGYLREVSGEEITAKDFRTWWATTIALSELDARVDALDGERLTKKDIVAAVKTAAEELGNTPAVCRSSYIHPGVLAAAESGELQGLLQAIDASPSLPELTIDETRHARLLPRLTFT